MKQSEIKELTTADLTRAVCSVAKTIMLILRWLMHNNSIGKPIAVKKLKKICGKTCNRVNQKR